MTLTSPAFVESGVIPMQYTCEAENLSVPLCWEGAPPGTKSYALVVDDPDAPTPQGGWVHWIVYDVPGDERGLSEGASSGQLPPGAREGLNDWRRTGWDGPCPPHGRHRYRFALYALDTTLADLDRPTKRDLESVMHGHVLAIAQLVGTYEKRHGRLRTG